MAEARVVVGVDVDPGADPAFGFAVEEATLRGATLINVRPVLVRAHPVQAPRQVMRASTCPLAVVRGQPQEGSNGPTGPPDPSV